MKFTISLLIYLYLSFALYSQNMNKEILKLQMAYKLVNTFYVDSLNASDIVNSAIDGMLLTLDPHSVYLTSDEVSESNELLDGKFEGIGIEFNIYKDTLVVVEPISGGPSHKIGVYPGDRIIRVDNRDITGIGLTKKEVFKLLKGPKGSQVSLSILRRGVGEVLDFKIVRDNIPINSVIAAYIVSEDVAYVKISRFSSHTFDEFKNAVLELQRCGAETFILDLTGNGGGYLSSAIQIVDEFFKENKLILYTEGQSNFKKEYYSKSNGILENKNLIVLIDEHSASASEIVAGAIQDWDRGVIIGRRSFGKGLVQRPFKLPDGSVIRLTIAKYYTPTGRCIQKSYEGGINKYNDELEERRTSGEMFTQKKNIELSSEVYYTKVQGRAVFGNGGITPDVFIATDSTSKYKSFTKILHSDILNIVVAKYLDENRDYLNFKYRSDFDLFKRDFKTDKLFDLLNHLLDNEYSNQQFSVDDARFYIDVYMKALVARRLWGSNEFYSIYNRIDNIFQYALKLCVDSDGIE